MGFLLIWSLCQNELVHVNMFLVNVGSVFSWIPWLWGQMIVTCELEKEPYLLLL